MPFDAPERFNISDYFLDDRIREGRGNRTAIVTPTGSWTYRQVQETANQFAHILRRLGVQPEQRVAIALPDIPEFPAALFGIVKVGACVIMLNPHLHDSELGDLLEFTRACALVVHSDFLPTFEQAARKSRYLRQFLVVGAPSHEYPSWEIERRTAATEFENAPTSRDEPAICLFSGGTTGRPKLVLQPHASFANSTENYAKGCIGYRETDITLSVPKLYFGYATGSNLLFPFSVGGTSALFPERATPETVFQYIARFRPTLLINVPSMINRMVSHPDASRQNLSSIRLCTSAGEALPEELYRRWRERFGTELLDGLGTAEMWHIFISNRPGDVKPGSIGKPVPGFDVRVRDEHGRDLPQGEIGRLWVRGGSRAICYLNRMDATQEAFRGEWYASADLIRQESDGTFTFLGRADDMIKVNARWISPQEIENCLLQHPSVQECAVTPFTEAGLTRIQAHVVLRPGLAPSDKLAEEIQEFVRQRLDMNRTPRRILFVPSLPRTHLGKVARGALKDQ